MRIDTLRRYPSLVLVAHGMCFWPVWRWYFARMSDGSDEPWGITALIAALLLAWSSDRGLKIERHDRLLATAAALTLIYAAVVPFAPPIIRAALAMSALACSWISVTRSQNKAPVIIALFVLSLPVIASVQFYAGYPLRAITASGATAFLDLFGMDVERTGTSMLWHGQTVLVDAPCSGVRMLWSSALLACLLLSQRRSVTWSGLCLVLTLVLPIVLAANTIRAALLFLLEIRTQPMPHWLHSGVGIFTFILAATALLLVERKLRRSSRSGYARYSQVVFRS
jgi:exosortase